MAELFESDSWALLPHEDVLEVLLSLVEKNCLSSTLPENRTLFTEVSPTKCAFFGKVSHSPASASPRRRVYLQAHASGHGRSETTIHRR